jgi:hypothetical protein
MIKFLIQPAPLNKCADLANNAPPSPPSRSSKTPLPGGLAGRGASQVRHPQQSDCNRAKGQKPKVKAGWCLRDYYDGESL